MTAIQELSPSTFITEEPFRLGDSILHGLTLATYYLESDTSEAEELNQALEAVPPNLTEDQVAMIHNSVRDYSDRIYPLRFRVFGQTKRDAYDALLAIGDRAYEAGDSITTGSILSYFEHKEQRFKRAALFILRNI